MFELQPPAGARLPNRTGGATCDPNAQLHCRHRPIRAERAVISHLAVPDGRASGSIEGGPRHLTSINGLRRAAAAAAALHPWPLSYFSIWGSRPGSAPPAATISHRPIDAEQRHNSSRPACSRGRPDSSCHLSAGAGTRRAATANLQLSGGGAAVADAIPGGCGGAGCGVTTEGVCSAVVKKLD